MADPYEGIGVDPYAGLGIPVDEVAAGQSSVRGTVRGGAVLLNAIDSLRGMADPVRMGRGLLGMMGLVEDDTPPTVLEGLADNANEYGTLRPDEALSNLRADVAGGVGEFLPQLAGAVATGGRTALPEAANMAARAVPYVGRALEGITRGAPVASILTGIGATNLPDEMTLPEKAGQVAESGLVNLLMAGLPAAVGKGPLVRMLTGAGIGGGSNAAITALKGEDQNAAQNIVGAMLGAGLGMAPHPQRPGFQMPDDIITPDMVDANLPSGAIPQQPAGPARARPTGRSDTVDAEFTDILRPALESTQGRLPAPEQPVEPATEPPNLLDAIRNAVEFAKSQTAQAAASRARNAQPPEALTEQGANDSPPWWLAGVDAENANGTNRTQQLPVEAPAADQGNPAGVVPVSPVQPPTVDQTGNPITGAPLTTDAPQPPARTAPARKPFYEMTPDEIFAQAEYSRTGVKEIENRILGPRADEYRKAVRQANSSDPKQADAGYEKQSAIEDLLTESEKNELFGMGEDPAKFDDVADYVDALDATHVGSEQEAAERLGYYLSQMGRTKGQDPSGWSRGEQVAYSAIRNIRDRIAESGWDSAAIQRNAIQRAAGRFSDPNDAVFMLERFMPKAAPRANTDASETPSLQVAELTETDLKEQEALARLDADLALYDEPPDDTPDPPIEIRYGKPRLPKPLKAETPAAHIDPGQPPEPVTPAVIEDAAQTVAASPRVSMKDARETLLAKIDTAGEAANADPWPKMVEGRERQFAANERDRIIGLAGHVTFDVPGDGKFKVVNNREAIAEFRAKVAAKFKMPPKPRPTPKPGYIGRSANITDAERVRILGEAEETVDQIEARELTDTDLTPAERAAFARQSGNAEMTDFLRTESARQGEEAATTLRPAVQAAVGDAEVTFLRDEDGLPASVKVRPKPKGAVRKGLYDPATKRVYIFTDGVTTPEDAAFTAAHEIAGHKGLRALAESNPDVQVGAKSAKKALDDALDMALQNPTVAAVADSMGKQRQSGDRLLNAEEALSDIAAATRTGDWSKVEAKHGKAIPESMRSGAKTAIARFIERIRRILNALMEKWTGKRFTDAQVHELVENAWQAAREGKAGKAEPGTALLEQRGKTADVATDEPALDSFDFDPDQREFMRKAGMADAVDAQTSISRAAEWAKGLAVDAKELAGPDRMAQSLVDRYHGIKHAEAEKGGIPFEQSAYIAARQINTASTMEAILRFGAPKLVNGALRVDRAVPGLLDALAPVADTMPQFLGWLVAGRARYLKSQGREHLMSDADIRAGLSLAKGHEEAFKKAATGYVKIKKAILDLAEHAGTIDPAARALWDHNEYVPFYRAMDGAFSGPGTRRGLANQSAGIRTLRGGESALKDPLGNIIANFTRLMDSAMKNRATLMAIDNLGPKYAAKQPMSAEVVNVPASQVKKYLESIGVPSEIIEGLAPNELRGIARMLAVKPPEGDDIVRVMRGGHPEYYKVADPMLLESLTAFNEEPMHWAVKPFVWAKNLLTAGATMTMEFAGANMLRDTGEAAITSREHFIPLADTIRGAVDQFRESELTQDLMMAGSYFHGGLFRTGDVEDTAKAIRRALRKEGMSQGAIEKHIKSLFNPIRWWDVYRSIAEASEMGSRISLARNRMKAGGTFLEAAHEAKDFLDFTMRGNARIVRLLVSVSPFLNARAQGAYRLGRVATARERRGRMLARMGLLSLASVALYLWNKEHFAEAYDELPDWDKDAYWHIMPGTEYHTRIPKPFELGLVAATLPERIYGAMEYQLTNGKEGDRPAQTARSLAHAITGTLALDPYPQLVKPVVETAANRNFFFDSPIESMGDRYKLPEDRYNAYTSSTMKAGSSAMTDVTGADFALSPKQMEHLWKGYTAGMGQYLLDSVDWVLDTADGKVRPEMALRDFPLIGRFARGDNPPRSTRYTDEFYELRDRATQIDGTIKQAMADGDTKRVKQLTAKWGWLLGSRTPSKRAKAGFMHGGVRALNRVSKELGDLRKEDQATYESRTLTPAEKRERIDRNAKQRNDLVRKMVRRLRELERKQGG